MPKWNYSERELAENRQLTQLIQRHLEEERRVLAGELHDEIGQYLTAIKTLGQAMANRAEAGSDARALESSRAIVSSAGHIYDAMHRIIRRLRPPALDRVGLADTLGDAVGEWRSLHPQLHIELRVPEALPRLGDEMEIALFRITQEAVTNAARHSRARALSIDVQWRQSGVWLCVQDDGVGMREADRSRSGQTGLRGMRERAQGLGGSLQVDSPSEGGTRIVAELPCRAAELPT